jgi:hypothetical protein
MTFFPAALPLMFFAEFYCILYKNYYLCSFLMINLNFIKNLDLKKLFD